MDCFLPLNRMMRQYPAALMRENQAAYLGVVGVFGFFILLKWILFDRTKEHEDGLKRDLSVFNASLLLLALTGGIGPLFAFVLLAYTVSITESVFSWGLFHFLQLP